MLLLSQPIIDPVTDSFNHALNITVTDNHAISIGFSICDSIDDFRSHKPFRSTLFPDHIDC